MIKLKRHIFICWCSSYWVMTDNRTGNVLVWRTFPHASVLLYVRISNTSFCANRRCIHVFQFFWLMTKADIIKSRFCSIFEIVMIHCSRHERHTYNSYILSYLKSHLYIPAFSERNLVFHFVVWNNFSMQSQKTCVLGSLVNDYCMQLKYLGHTSSGSQLSVREGEIGEKGLRHHKMDDIQFPFDLRDQILLILCT